MKTIKFVTTFIIALTGMSFAQTSTGGGGGGGGTVTPPTVSALPPVSLPIGSKGMLRAYAIEQVAGSNISVWSEAIMWTSDSVTSVYFHPEVAPSVDEALQAITSTHFSFKVSDKTKPLSVYADLHDKNGMSMFWGQTEASISDSGKIVCPSGVRMKMNSHLPIYVGENVNSASIRLDNGIWDPVNVWNGYLFFNSDYAERDGMLVLDYNDGNIFEQIGYALRTGAKVPLFAVAGNVDVYLQDFQSFLDEGMSANQVMYVGMTGLVGHEHEAPVAYIEITSARQVKFSCVLRDAETNAVLEKPLNGWIYQKGSDREIPVSLVPVAPGQWSAPLTVGPGKWFFYIETGLYETPGGEKGE